MIDLRSDTVTTPSAAMREAARDAEVGDDVYREDPTVDELERRAADLVGMEAALYVPSGTMGNQVAVTTHTEPGQEAVVERESHVYKWELGGIAQHAGVQPRTVDGGERGVVAASQVREAYVEADGHRPGTGLVCLENTHNAKGGAAIAPETIDAAAEAAHDLGVPVHLDGARVPNAAVALDVPVVRLTREVDSVMFCLSKGLGAPVGSVLAGSEAFVERARRNRKLFGGGMRQAGLIAAPGLLALENVDRLAEDHANARALADGLSDLGLSVGAPETNIVLVETDAGADRRSAKRSSSAERSSAGRSSGARGEQSESLDVNGDREGAASGRSPREDGERSDPRDDAESFLDACEAEGVLGVPFAENVVRFCTHRDVDREDVDAAIAAVERAR